MMKFETYGDRLNYLMLLDNNVDSPRHISSELYHHKTWYQVRDVIMYRDLSQDLGVNGLYIPKGKLIIHHINPIKEIDILEWNEDRLFNPEFLICTSFNTHNAIHYGRKKLYDYVERKPGDTDLW